MGAKIRMKRHSVILTMVLVSAFLICNFTEDVSERLIKGIYSIFAGKEIVLDDSGIPIVGYGYINGIYIGRQRNPVTISQKALYYYESYEKGNESDRQLFLNCSD